MPRRPVCLPLLALCLLALAPAAALAQGSDPAGTYRVGSDQTSVQVPEWGSDCGPRPESHTGNAGRSVTVTVDGAQLAVQDGRHRQRTDSCWSENPRVRRISVGHSGNRWTVVCETPEAEYQHERGTYVLTASDTQLTYRETTEYSWQLRTSRCRATATRAMNMERTAAAPPVVATTSRDAGANATPVREPPPPPPNRCASVGAPARIEIVPGRRALAPGGRTCFRARVLDANRCEVPSAAAGSVAWALARGGGVPGANDPAIEQGCVRAVAGSAVGEYTVTATAGALSGRAIAAVVSTEDFRSLVAQHIEDEDAGAPVVLATGETSRTGLGTVNLPALNAQPASRIGLPITVWALIGLGVLLVVGGVALLTGRKPPPRASVPPGARRSGAPGARTSVPPGASNRARREAVGIPARELPIANGLVPPRVPAITVADPSQAPPSAASGARPLVKRCPMCERRFTEEMAFCPEDGATLLRAEGSAPSAAPEAIAAGDPASAVLAPICPVCGLPVGGGAAVCPRDGTPVARDALPLVCSKCGKRFGLGTAFCGEDGAPLVRG